MKKAILYIRVSTDEQADKGYSLQHQEEFLRRYCETNSIYVEGLVREDYSAKTFNRPEFSTLLHKLKSRQMKADFLIFTKWDRFSRNAPDAYSMIATLNKLGVEPQAVEQPLDLDVPENKIMLAFYLSAPEVENDRRALNTLVGMRRAKKEGRWISTAPKGYSNKTEEGGRKVIVPNDDAPIIKWAFERLATGKYSMEEVRRMCIEKGLVLSKSRFHCICRSSMYCGRVVIPAYKNEPEQIVRGVYEPIVSEAIFDRAQEVLSNKRFAWSYKVCDRPELPLRGFLNCPRCGRKLCGSGSMGGSGKKHFYYHCLHGCKERVKAPEVNAAFVDYLETFQYKAGVYELYDKVMAHVFENKLGDKIASRHAIQEDLDRNKERINRAQKMMLDGEMSMAEYKEIKCTIEPLIEKLLMQQMNLNHEELGYRDYLEKGLNALKNIRLLFDNVDLSGKREIVRSSLKENAVFSNGRVRTEKPNSLIVLTAGFDGELRGKKKRKGSQFSSPSRMVPYWLKLSNFIEDFSRIRKLKAFMEIKQLA